MESFGGVIIILIFIILIVFIIRIFGAWMLRINEIISLQEKTLNGLKKIHEELQKIAEK